MGRMAGRRFWTVAAAAVALASGTARGAGAKSMHVTETDWGKTSDGTPVKLFTLTDRELTVTITTFGARVVSLLAPDRDGRKDDVVLGYDSVAKYEADTSTYFGAIVGRYGNRIAKGQFTIDGRTYQVPPNNNGNALHGGPKGFSTKVWTAAELPNGVILSLVSPDGEMGFPGTLRLSVVYTLSGRSLSIEYFATTTLPTVVNVTNHSYFNLADQGRGNILGEEMTIPADSYTPTDATLIPTGEIAPVEGTPFDFRQAKTIGSRIHEVNAQLRIAGGYDHNFVLDGVNKPGLHLAAMVYDPGSGRTLEVKTSEPGVQFYSGNFLDGSEHGKYGVTYQKNAGFCLETQHFPDSPNEPKFPSTLLQPGQTMHSTTVFTFGVRHGDRP
jgi:aldose 1-epimerase